LLEVTFAGRRGGFTRFCDEAEFEQDRSQLDDLPRGLVDSCDSSFTQRAIERGERPARSVLVGQ
jgi:hypothetical protein